MTSQHDKAKRWQFGLRQLLGLFVLIGLVSLAARACYVTVGPAMPVHLMRQIETGMHKSEVLRILGEPKTKSERDWVYRRPGNKGYFHVAFDDNECVLYLNDESLIGNNL